MIAGCRYVWSDSGYPMKDLTTRGVGRNVMKKLMPVVIAVGLIFLAPVLSRADIINGDFTAGLLGWVSYDTTKGGPSLDGDGNPIVDGDGNPIYISPTKKPPSSASVSVSAGQAVMATQPYNVDDPNNSIGKVTLYQTAIEIPALATMFRFDVGFSTMADDTSIDPNRPPLDVPFPDWLSVSYWDATGPNGYDRLSFFNIDGTGAYGASGNTLTSGGTYNGLQRFSFDITELRGRTGALYFDLFDTYDGYSSIATLDNIQFETGSGPAPVPEPGTMLLLGSGLAGLAGWGRKKIGK